MTITTTLNAGLLEVVAAGIYLRGLKNVAQGLPCSEGNLCRALSRKPPRRKFGVEELEEYIQRFGDKTPIYYLVAKYLGDEAAARDQALGQVQQLLTELPGMLAAAGLAKIKTAR